MDYGKVLFEEQEIRVICSKAKDRIGYHPYPCPYSSWVNLLQLSNNNFLEELISCFPLILHEPHRKRKKIKADIQAQTHRQQSDLLSLHLFYFSK
jgi:hypothetical protein